MVAIFDLTANPFHLLAVSIRASREDVAEAYEAAILDGHFGETDLLRAQQALVVPRQRLEAEVSWLPTIAPSQATKIVDHLARGQFSSVVQSLEELGGLDLANVAADLCCRSGSQPPDAVQLIRSHKEISTEALLDSLNGVHAVSGFAQLSQEMVENALAGLRGRHAKAALTCITACAEPSRRMTDLVEEFLGHQDVSIDQFLSVIATEYDAWAQPKMRVIRDAIGHHIGLIKSGSEAASPSNSNILRIEEHLTEWDDLSQPMQLIEQSKGHDEARSKEIYGELRELCLWLANEQNEYDSALRISKALLKTFPELPTVSVQVDQDISTLETLAEEARAAKVMAPLIAVVEVLSSTLQKLDADLAGRPFDRSARGLAKQLYQAFVTTLETAKGTEYASMPWAVVRSVAIQLNNEANAPEAALAVLNGLIAYAPTKPPRDVLERLRSDIRSVRRNLRWEELRNTARSGDIETRLSLVSDLLAGAEDADEREMLNGLKHSLEAAKAAKARKSVFWAAAIILFLGFALYEATDQPQATSRTYAPPTAARQPSNYFNQFQESRPESKSTTSALQPTAVAIEERPPVGTNRILSIKQIRYCVFQSERLKHMRQTASEMFQVALFNSLVGDYNSRCGTYRYRGGQLESVQQELPDKRVELHREAELLLGHRREKSGDGNRNAVPRAALRQESRDNVVSVPDAAANSKQTSRSNTASAPLIDLTVPDGAKVVQQRLHDLGFYPGPIDGLWGTASRSALSRFKAARELPWDERWDDETQKKLFSR